MKLRSKSCRKCTLNSLLCISTQFGRLRNQKAETSAQTNTSVQQSEAMLKNLSVELEAEKQKKEELLKKAVAKAQADEFYQEMIKLIRSHSPDIEKVVELALKQERLQAERKDQHVIAIGMSIC